MTHKTWPRALSAFIKIMQCYGGLMEVAKLEIMKFYDLKVESSSAIARSRHCDGKVCSFCLRLSLMNQPICLLSYLHFMATT